MGLLKNFIFSDFFKYGIVSLIALIIDVTTLTIAKELLNLPSLIAATTGFTLGLVFVYIISVKYIFGRSDHSRSVEFIYFTLIGVIGLIINDLIIAAIEPFSSIYIAKFFAIFIVFTWNFIARKKLMTKKEIIDE